MEDKETVDLTADSPAENQAKQQGSGAIGPIKTVDLTADSPSPNKGEHRNDDKMGT